MIFRNTYFSLPFILFLFTSVILGVVKIGGPWTRSMKGVHGPGPYFDGPGPRTRSTEGVHGPGVHVLYFPKSRRVTQGASSLSSPILEQEKNHSPLSRARGRGQTSLQLTLLKCI